MSRNPHLFCSGKGANIGDQPQEMNEFFGSMINMDDPRHFRLRSIVSRGFTPKEITAVEDTVRTKANEVIDRLLANFPDKTCDFVENVAAALPLEIICDMMGIPAEDYAQVFKWTNTILGAGDPEFTSSFDDLMGQSLEMFMYAQALGEDRKANPQDDITSIMMAAEVDGEQLTPQEFGSFFILLVVAGNETTRNAISHGMLAFTEHPDQRDLLYGDFDTHAKGAMEEIVRWGTPVIHFRRTATEDTEIGGTDDRGRREGGHVVQLGQSRRAGVRGSVPVRHHPRAEPRPDRLRRRRPALLPRRQPRSPGDDRDVRHDPPAGSVAADHGRARLPPERVHQRHQADAVCLGLSSRPSAGPTSSAP